MNPSKLWLLLLLVTAGCYADRSVGVSTGRDRDNGPPVKAKFPSKVVGQVGEALTLESPLAGDMDGDGLSDFLVLAMREPALDGTYKRPLLYLFYGKAEFPAELSTADAEAAFEVDSGFNGTVGDLNGDGYSDLMLTLSDSANFIFGGGERLHGLVERGMGGVLWTFDALPEPFSTPGLLVQPTIRGVGDLNGDGCADLILRAGAQLSFEIGDYIERAWVIPGYRGEWQSTAWNGSPVLASVGEVMLPELFDPNRAVGLLDAEGAGDVDGDERADLVALGPSGSLMFYGKPDYPTELSATAADATLFTTTSQPAITDDLGRPFLFARRLGDLDGDGKDDLVVAGDSAESSIAYGQRWSGDSEIHADLQISTGSQQRLIMSAAAGDIDGDGFPELVLQVADIDEEMVVALASSVYVLRGTGERMRGKVRLTEDDRWSLPVALPASGLAVYQLTLGGDIDGDGSQEILTSFIPQDPWAPTAGPVYLVPSTPRAPD